MKHKNCIVTFSKCIHSRESPTNRCQGVILAEFIMGIKQCLKYEVYPLQVIDQLVIQRSRNEFLTMALEVELRRHHKINHILTSLHTHLNYEYNHWTKRMVWVRPNCRFQNLVVSCVLLSW